MNEKNSVNCFEEYVLQIEQLRSIESKEFSHLSNITFLDHAANGIYMNSLISDYHEKLTFSNLASQNSVSPFFSNPHSHNLSGIYTNMYVDLVRQKILELFNTKQNDYDVVFVMNATHGLKLLAETFNFSELIETDNKNATSSDSYFAYLNDNHTSVVGLREIVWSNHQLTKTYCLIENNHDQLNFDAKSIESPYEIQPDLNNKIYKFRSLLVFPAQSNFNGRKYDLNLIDHVQKQGLKVNQSQKEKTLKSDWYVCLDTASYVSTSNLDLSTYKPDFLVVSFYKIFGFPTGIGALIIKKTERIKHALSKKTYFGGGTVSMALIDENKVCYRNCSIKDMTKHKSNVNNYLFHEFLEDGTISYLQIVGVGLAIDKFKKLTYENGFKLIKDYTSNLTNYCVDKMDQLEHFNGQKLVIIYRKSINGSIKNNYGPIISFNLRNSMGFYIGFRLVDKLAQENQIYLRTGCFCNIGACQMFMEHLKDNKKFFENFKLHGHECGDHIDMIDDLPTGAIRISFGYCSLKQDIDKFIQFLADYFIEDKHNKMNNLIMNIENTKLNLNLDEQQYFQITQIYIYPIKSCAPMKIKTKWFMNNGGFLYDRNWVIVDNNLLPLTQKRYKLLTKIKPFIEIDNNILRLEYENESIEIVLEGSDEESNDRLINVNNLTGYDQGDQISEWLTDRVFKTTEKFRLVRIDSNLSNNNTAKTSFVNKADYLLINEDSISKLRNYLDSDFSQEKNDDLTTYNKSYIDEYLCLQFRPNIVVSTIKSSKIMNETTFEEEFWVKLKILNKNLEFQTVENCTRCQMINISQNEQLDEANSLSIYSRMLLKKLYKLKSNSKFGIYLSKKNTSQDFLEENKSINQHIKSNISNELLIGDIGIAFTYNNN